MGDGVISFILPYRVSWVMSGVDLGFLFFSGIS